MKFKIVLDNFRRQSFKKYEITNLGLKIGIRIHYKLKLMNIVKLSGINQNTNFSRYKNRCFISGRSFAVYKQFKMSRIKFRELINNGIMAGLKKSSW